MSVEGWGAWSERKASAPDSLEELAKRCRAKAAGARPLLEAVREKAAKQTLREIPEDDQINRLVPLKRTKEAEGPPGVPHTINQA